MRVDKVNQVKGIGLIKFNNDTEMDLIAESMDRLINKQTKIAERNNNDTAELAKLERFKESKDVVVEIPRQNKMRMQAMKNIVKTQNEERHQKNRSIGIIADKVDVEDTPEFKRMNAVRINAEDGSGLNEGTEVTHRNMHVLVNALNEHIWEMEKDGLNTKTKRNRLKYEKLQQMLANAQEQKSHFERVRPKPRGFGRLRK